MAATDRLERLINLVIALRETRIPLTAAEIRERVAGYGQRDHEAFRRMFERDKADLRGLGVPIDTAQIDPWGDDVGYRIDPDRYDLPEVELQADELAALAVAVEATGLADEAVTGLRKLEVVVGTPGTSVTATRPPLEVDLSAPFRERLVEAQLTRTPVRFRYRPVAGEESERAVDPHGLVHRRGRWYLVGRDHDRDARRAFRLDRIRTEPRPAGPAGAFEPPADPVTLADVVPGVEGPPQLAEVVAAPEVAWQVARRARGGGAAEPDGWIAYRVPVGDPDLFCAWVLENAGWVELRAPAELRDRVLGGLRRVAAP